MNLTVKVIIGMLLGIVVGLAINLGGLNAPGSPRSARAARSCRSAPYCRLTRTGISPVP